jgi:phosphonate degradation associated HDIG domain protein
MGSIVDDIRHLYMTKGARQYGDEAVSQLAHALQCATLAKRAGASPALIAAALLHDIGHLIDGGDEESARAGIDARHERRGGDFLAAHFVEAVSAPVRLHVDAKRYLCAVDPGYRDDLSPASKRSLELQGGVFLPAAALSFAGQPFAEDAARLRRWDDLAKDTRAATAGLDRFRPYLEAALRGA